MRSLTSTFVLALGLCAAACATGNGVGPRGGDVDAGRRDGDVVPLDGGGGPVDGGGGPVDGGGGGIDAAPVDAFVPAFDSGTACTGAETRPCSTACSTLGVATCSGGVLGACVPPAEVCDGIDQDCDARVDEMLTRGCSTACGAGTETCSAGSWISCSAPAPAAETCDGVDQDCDARVDEMLTRGCSTACGSGTETCSSGSWISCSAPAPSAEVCNRADEDCDGRVDEGQQVRIFDPVPMAELTAAQPPCSGPGSGMDVCMSAAHRWCASHTLGCFDGGAGHLQATATGARVVCFGERADVRAVTFSTVSSASGITVTGSNVYTRVAQSAVNRYCRSVGFDSGIGPVEHSDPTLYVICLPSELGAYTDLPTSTLNARGCDPLAAPNTLGCQSASDLECRARGHQGGYGPVEWNASMSAIVCFR